MFLQLLPIVVGLFSIVLEIFLHTFLENLDDSTQQDPELTGLGIFFSEGKLIVEGSIVLVLLSGPVVEVHVLVLNLRHLNSIFYQIL
jgi:hypothetical protein